MSKKLWVRQLTRENALLDRSLRSIAYAKSIPEVGKAKMNECPVVGEGKITSWYYDIKDYRHQQSIILKEFQGKKINILGQKIIDLLTQALTWAEANEHRKVSRKNFIAYLQNFNAFHAYGRGAIVYGYWGEPAITTKLKKSLKNKISAENIDHSLSVLSAPKIINGPLKKLYHPSNTVNEQRNRLIKKLKLNLGQKDLAEILSWFTIFYELGERVSSLLYDQLVKKLKKLTTRNEFEVLTWYDPEALEKYFLGKKLPSKELKLRKKQYVLLTKNNFLKILTGKTAAKFIKLNFGPTDEVRKTNELRGVTASVGMAVGRVKIIITQVDQKKMQQGDILLSPMTTPRLMSSVHKAAAIVTDEGGLTAHAAIVARELNIPCIIGTKIATKIFKDGDMVEVDANKGIVKKI